MKIKIKEIVVGITLSYMLIFTILTIKTLINCPKEITINNNYNYDAIITNLKEDVQKVKSLSCQNSLKKMISIAEANIFDGTINLQDFYKQLQDNGSTITGFVEVKNNCNLTADEINSLSPYILNSTAVYDDIIQNYKFQYEITIKDKPSRYFAEATVIGTQLKTAKLQELDTIKKIIEVTYEK